MIAHGVSRGMGFTKGEEPRMGRKRTFDSRWGRGWILSPRPGLIVFNTGSHG